MGQNPYIIIRRPKLDRTDLGTRILEEFNDKRPFPALVSFKETTVTERSL